MPSMCVSWSPLTQQNVPGTTIRRFCDSTGYALVAPSEPTRFHLNCRNTTIDIAICKESSFQENPEPYDDDFIDHVEEKSIDSPPQLQTPHRTIDLTTRDG
ncbi:hypothetical protein TNCV_164161 [Trichonephila clavipes]|nr:hypothetical protein TNCV_164161 [Trichonephila clavipes]